MLGLNRYLLEILQTFGETCIYPALYCDAIYQLTKTIINRYSQPNRHRLWFFVWLHREFSSNTYFLIKKIWRILLYQQYHTITEEAADYLLHIVYLCVCYIIVTLAYKHQVANTSGFFHLHCKSTYPTWCWFTNGSINCPSKKNYLYFTWWC